MPGPRPQAVRRVGHAESIAGEAWRVLGHVLWRRRLLISAAVAVVLGVTMAHVARVKPSFEAVALVAVTDRGAGVDPQLGQPGQVLQSEEQDLEDQLNLIESPTTAARLVYRLGLQSVPEFNPGLGNDGVGTSNGGRDLNRLIPELLAERLPKAWLDSFGIVPPAPPTDQERAARLHDQVVDAVAARIRAELVDPSTLSLKFVSEDAELAASGANALADLFLTDWQARRQENRQREHQRLEQEIERLTTSIDASEKSIAQAGAPVDAGPNWPSEQDLLSLSGELAFWRGERAKIRARLGQVRDYLGSEAALDQAAKLLDTVELGKLQAREVELEQELAELSRVNTEQEPQIASLREELTALKGEKGLEVEETVGRLEKEIEIIRSLETALEARMETLEGLLAENQAADGPATLKRRLEVDRKLRQTYLEQAQQLAAPATAQEPDAQIISRGEVPVAPAYPRLAVLYPSALGGGLILGIFLALGLKALERFRV